MKIAFPTNNGKRINAHFGYATHYLVVTVENGAEVAREMREKDSHAGKHDDHHHHNGNGHGHGNGHHHNHGGMAAPLADCDILIAGGMGAPAARAVQSMGVQIIPTNISSIDTALTAFLAGELPLDPGAIHNPGHHH